MAEKKNRGPWVNVPFDMFDGIRMLNDAQMCELFDAIFEYAFDNKEPSFGDDLMLKMAWAFVKPNLEMGED